MKDMAQTKKLTMKKFIIPFLLLGRASAFAPSSSNSFPFNLDNPTAASIGLQTASSLSFFQRNCPETEPTIVQGVGEDGCAIESPSKVNSLPEPIQAGIVLGIFGAMVVATVPFSGFLSSMTTQYEWVQTWRYSWPLLGAIYAAAGVTHFTIQEEYENIYPTRGAWGFWYLPGSPAFHVKWTGAAEVLGGVGLLLGVAIDAFLPVYNNIPDIITEAGIASDSAACLLLLTATITPANIFMYTHGARLPKDGPEVPIVGHAIRGVMQIVLFGLLYQMGEGTFDALISANMN